MTDGLRAETVEITGHQGDRLEAYLAQPLAQGPRGGVVVIHHMPGYDDATKEITRRFAAQGYLALCPNLYSREAPGASADDAAATVRAAGGVPDERLVGDVGGAAQHLRSLDASNGRVATIGYCSGGRQSFLAACSLPLEAAVDCYGAFVVGTPPEGMPLKITPLTDRVGDLGCPLLGLFGAEDQHPSPVEVAELDGLLRAAGKQFEFHTYQGAGHGFFASDRPSYRPEAATQGWERIWDFFGRHLGG
ncbi:MAG: dienelactone hydrolase family protein [Candidatus Dormibacteria bacterium]